MLSDQPLRPVAVGVDHRDQLDPVGQFADHLAVDGADDAGTDKGQPIRWSDSLEALMRTGSLRRRECR